MNQAEWKPVPDGIVKQARRNWYALCFHHTELAKTLHDPLAHIDQFELCLCDGEIRGVRCKSEPTPRIFLPHENGAALLVQQQNALRQHVQSGKRLTVIAGLCSGRLLDATKQLLDEYPAAAVCLFEPDIDSWCAAMLDATVPEAFQHPRLFLFGGADAYTHAIDFIRKEYLFLLPHAEFAYMLGVMPTDENAPGYIQSAKDAAAAIQQKSIQFEETLSVFLLHTQTALRGTPQSIWACTHRESYIHFPLLNAFLRGFHQAGLRTRLSEYDHGFTANFRVMGELLKSKPDCIFSINAWPGALLEDFGLAQDAVKSMQIPRVCWLVDDTQLYEDSHAQKPFNDYDWVIASDRSYLPWLKQLTQQAFFMPPAAMFDKKGTMQEKYAAAISYVGSLPNVRNELRSVSPITQELLKKIEVNKREQPTQSFIDLLNQLSPSSESREQLSSVAEQFTSQTRKGFQTSQARVEYLLYNVATYLKRMRIVEALLPLGLCVYGPESWRDALPLKFKNRYRAFVANHDLANVYASSRLSLNIHSHQCPTCLNTRDFDVPMAGGAVLGDWVEDVDRGFLEPGKETLAFHTTDEAVEAAQQIFSNQAALDSLRRDGHNRVASEHTYKRRAQSLLTRISQ